MQPFTMMLPDLIRESLMPKAKEVVPHVMVLSQWVDYYNMGDSMYRVLIDGKDVKYVNIGPCLYPRDVRSFEISLRAHLPRFPPGN